MKSEINSQWKGPKAKYQAFHNWIRRHFGKPNYCEMCKIDGDKRIYHWAAKNKAKGGRERTDWLRLCVPCHAKFDGRTGSKISETHKKRIAEKNKIALLGNKCALGHKLSIAKRKEIGKAVSLAYKNRVTK